MPAKSKAQQRLMGFAYSNPEVRKQMGIKKKDARDFAKTKHDDLPDKVDEAYYGGEEQRKKDEKKKKIDDFMNKAMPARTFDQFGRETDRRTGKLKEGWLTEGKKPRPLGKMVAKAFDLDARAAKEKDMDKKQKLEDRARIIQMNAHEQLDGLLNDPLEELWDLHENMNVVSKPTLQEPEPSSVRGPDLGNYEHPVTQQKKQVNSQIASGTDPVTAHQVVHGEVDAGDVESKAKLAATLGRLQDDSAKTGVKAEPGSTSIYATDAKIEKAQDQVTHNDLRTPMNQEVPDAQQTPADQVAEDVNIGDDYDYNEDVAFLQKYGRA